MVIVMVFIIMMIFNLLMDFKIKKPLDFSKGFLIYYFHPAGNAAFQA